MTNDLDTLLIALYVEIDDHVALPAQRGRGRPKRLSDAELICLAMAQVLPGARSEHHWLRLCCGRLGHLFPYLPGQPGYHKRLKAAAPLLAAVMDHLARQSPGWHDPVRLIDTTPVPCGAPRETVRRSELAGWAHYKYCAAHSRWYWGLKLYLITTPDGMPAAWCLADPKIGEREVAGELLAHAARTGALRPGLTLIGDKGFAGREFEDLVTTGYSLSMVRPDRRDEAPRHGPIGWIRQWIESVNDTLKGQLDLERHGGRTTEGLYARITQWLLAMAACIWHNSEVAALELMTRALVGVTDMIRLNDMLRLDDEDPIAPVVRQMRYRADVVRGLTGEALEPRDYAALRELWAGRGPTHDCLRGIRRSPSSDGPVTTFQENSSVR